MVFVSYNEGKLTSFSDSKPKEGDYVEIDESQYKRLSKKFNYKKYKALTIKDKKPSSVITHTPFTNEEYIDLNKVVINLIGASFKDLLTAQSDLETILSLEQALSNAYAKYDH